MTAAMTSVRSCPPGLPADPPNGESVGLVKISHESRACPTSWVPLVSRCNGFGPARSPVSASCACSSSADARALAASRGAGPPGSPVQLRARCRMVPLRQLARGTGPTGVRCETSADSSCAAPGGRHTSAVFDASGTAVSAPHRGATGWPTEVGRMRDSFVPGVRGGSGWEERGTRSPPRVDGGAITLWPSRARDRGLPQGVGDRTPLRGRAAWAAHGHSIGSTRPVGPVDCARVTRTPSVRVPRATAGRCGRIVRCPDALGWGRKPGRRVPRAWL